MSKDIWHTQKETPEDDRLIVVENYSGFISVGSEFEYDLDRVRKWAYFDDLLALETELERTRKALKIALDAIDKGEAALIGCQEADDKYISDVTAEDGLELMSKAYKQIKELNDEKHI